MPTLLFIPTYNERENVPRMCAELLSTLPGTHLLFLDDNSPDGTGDLLDQLAIQNPGIVHVIHRPGKLGIGSAHKDGIAWAYQKGYTRLITMDCDFTHSPADLPAMIAASAGHDITVGSRFLRPESLPGWSLLRRCLTGLGHQLTRTLLRITFDATGALRIYNLERLPKEIFHLVSANGYAFFFESLFVIHRNNFSIKEIPIVLPARTYGSSKMTLRETLRSTRQLFGLCARDLAAPAQFLLPLRTIEPDPTLSDPQGWDSYWNQKNEKATLAYEIIASIYRRLVIRPQIERFVKKHFPQGQTILHAGCGSGQVDVNLQKNWTVTAVDISLPALEIYQRHNPAVSGLRHASIFNLPFPPASFHGVYNMGVMEHFTQEEIARILAEFHRVLRPDGRLLIFWPHRHASSVYVLNFTHWILHRILKKTTSLHPPEVSLHRSRKHASALLAQAGFQLSDYEFGPRDGFVQAVLVAQKTNALP